MLKPQCLKMQHSIKLKPFSKLRKIRISYPSYPGTEMAKLYIFLFFLMNRSKTKKNMQKEIKCFG